MELVLNGLVFWWLLGTLEDSLTFSDKRLRSVTTLTASTLASLISQPRIFFQMAVDVRLLCISSNCSGTFIFAILLGLNTWGVNFRNNVHSHSFWPACASVQHRQFITNDFGGNFVGLCDRLWWYSYNEIWEERKGDN